ncbi:MAG: SOS response-associated peptidase [Pseudomonadota bacterium]
MCGRYLLTTPPSDVGAAFDVGVVDNFPPRYNIAPTQPVAAIRRGTTGAREYTLLRWGFIPSWRKKEEGRPLINARAETVSEKPTFRAAFKRRRCLIPADGFYEWTGEKAARMPHYIRPERAGVFAFAGIWETAMSADGAEVDTVALLTTAAGPDIKALHHREPVVIAASKFAAWLETDERDIGEVSGLLTHQHKGFWRTTPVSKRVNSVRNEGPDLILPEQSGDLFAGA